jgi:16S rRNA G1207 methylase RsmC
VTSDESLEPLAHRQVRYNYRGRSFEFALTRALFSSAGVDAGTHQLLGLIAQTLPGETFETVVDVGCGTGTLGIPLAATFNGELLAIDRDALACRWSFWNARSNGLESPRIEVAVLPPYPEVETRTLAVSNLPAKAGQPVLDRLLASLATQAQAPGSRIAVVVVAPLSPWLDQACTRLGLEVTGQRKSANHRSVVLSLHRGGKANRSLSQPPEELVPRSFIRCSDLEFPGPDREYLVETVYGLPEFDGLSFRTALAFDLLRSVQVSGTVLVRGVGQGHLPAAVIQRSRTVSRLLLSDRDLLALRIGEHNVRKLVGSELPVTCHPYAFSTDHIQRTPSVHWLVVAEEPFGGSDWIRGIARISKELLVPGGKLLFVARSTTIGRFQKAAGKHFTAGPERRMHGERSQLFSRKR